MLSQLIRSYVNQAKSVTLRSTFQLQSILFSSFQDREVGKQKQRDRRLRPPTRPPTPYLLFYKEQFHKVWDDSAISDKRAPVIAKKLAGIWNSKSDYEKEFFQNRCEQLWEYYNDRRRVYEERATEEDRNLVREEKAMRKKRKLQAFLHKDRKENVPPRPSPFGLFIHEKSKSFGQSLKGPQLFKELAEDWRKLSEDQKRHYKEKSSDKMKIYNERLQSWRAKHEGDLL